MKLTAPVPEQLHTPTRLPDNPVTELRIAGLNDEIDPALTNFLQWVPTHAEDFASHVVF